MIDILEDLFKKIKSWGFRKETSEILTRLVEYIFLNKELPPDEKARWIELNVLKPDGCLYASKKEIEDYLFWMMIGLVWEGEISLK